MNLWNKIYRELILKEKMKKKLKFFINLICLKKKIKMRMKLQKKFNRQKINFQKFRKTTLKLFIF